MSRELERQGTYARLIAVTADNFTASDPTDTSTYGAQVIVPSGVTVTSITYTKMSKYGAKLDGAFEDVVINSGAFIGVPMPTDTIIGVGIPTGGWGYIKDIQTDGGAVIYGY